MQKKGSLLSKVNKLIQDSGKILLQHFDFFDGNVDIKSDGSPVTKADQEISGFLIKELKKIKKIPVLTEEIDVEFSERKNWKQFWIVDPLDGTKEFIDRKVEFCINIALIKNSKPVLGVIFAPKVNELYSAEEGLGFFFNEQKFKQKNVQIKNKKRLEDLVVALSCYHHSKNTEKFLQANNLTLFKKVGAAIKFGRMALGEIDLYPRFEGSKEWDTAAGQIILAESGCSMLDLETNKPPLYNKSTVQNNFFIAFNQQIDFNCLKISRR